MSHDCLKIWKNLTPNETMGNTKFFGKREDDKDGWVDKSGSVNTKMPQNITSQKKLI